MEYEIEERPLQMGEERDAELPFGYRPPSVGPTTRPHRPPQTPDRAMLIPEQEPLS